ncbi:MAG: restriction endonuclease subunit S [Bacillota bacterium]
MKPEIKKRIEQIRKGAVPEGYKKTKVGIVPDEWDVKQLKHILNQVERKVSKPQDGYWRLGLRSHAKGTFHEFVGDPDSIAMEELFLVAENDLIVNITFAWEHAIALANRDDEGKLVSHRFPTYVFNAKACPYFYKYYVIQSYFKKMLSDISPGGAGRNRVMSKSSFQKLFAVLPPLPEQEKIAEILSTWDKAIELKEQLIAEKKQLKKWLMQNLLTGKKRLPGFADEWQKFEVGKVISQSSNKINPIIEKQTFKCIELEHIESETGRLLGSTISSIQKSNKSYFAKGDVLFGKLRPYLKKFHYAKHEGVCSSEIWVLRPKTKDMLSKYLFYTVQSSKFIDKCCVSSGSKMPRADWDYVLSLVIYLPSLLEQTAIAEFLSTVDRKIDLHEKQLEELKKQKKALMQLLLTGIVRVNAQEVS